jgi:CYTH domain-containing protein
LEVELCTKDEAVELPPFIPITKEVTGDKRYSNAALARAL